MRLFLLSQKLGSGSLCPRRLATSSCLKFLDTSSPPSRHFCSSSPDRGSRVLGVLSSPTRLRNQPALSSQMGARSSASVSTLLRARAFPRLYRASHQEWRPSRGYPGCPSAPGPRGPAWPDRSSPLTPKPPCSCGCVIHRGARSSRADAAAPASPLRLARLPGVVVWGGHSAVS